MICIYDPSTTDFANNGLGILQPIECKVREVAACKYELSIVHPIDDTNRWAQIVNHAVIKVPVPVRESPLYETETDVVSGGQTTVVRKVYRTNTRNMYLRQEAKSATKKLRSLPVGTQVVLMGQEGKWAKVTTVDGGQVGYCPMGGLTYVRDQDEVVTETKIVGKQVIQVQQSRMQLFRVTDTEINSDELTITATARHITYDELGDIIDDAYVYDDDEDKKDPLATALARLESKLVTPRKFNVHAERVSGDVKPNWSYVSRITALLDPDEGIVHQIGCLVMRDNFDFYLLPDNTRDMGVTIRRGKNLIGVTVKNDASNIVTRIIPCGKDKDGNDMFLDGERFVDSPHAGEYPFINVQKVDYDVKIVDKDPDNKTTFKKKADALAKLRELAQKDYSENGVDLPDYSMEVDFVLLGNTAEYAEYANLQAVHLYDTVTVIDEVIGLKAKLRVTEYEFDCLTQQYTSVTLGKLEEVQPTIYSYQIPNGSVSGTKLISGSVSGSVLRSASLDYAKIKHATIEQLAADAVTAVTGRFHDVATGKITTDELYASVAEMIRLKLQSLTAQDITAETIAAELARLQVLIAGTATFDRATVQHLVAQAMNLEYGVGNDVFVSNLRVAYAQMVSAAIGNLVIGASDGNYYAIDVNADGTVTATQATVTEDEISAGQTQGGKTILGTSIVADDLSTSNLLATYALINKIDAARIDTDILLARQAFVDALYTSNIFGGKSLQTIAGTADEALDVVNKMEIGDRNLLTGTRDFTGDNWINRDKYAWQETKRDGLTILTRAQSSGYGVTQEYTGSAGDVFTASAWVWTSPAASFDWYADGGTAAYAPYTARIAVEDSKWTRVSFTFKVTNDGTIRPRVACASANTAWGICGLKLARGNKSTDWTEAPEDIDIDIDEVSTGLKTYSDASEYSFSTMQTKQAAMYDKLEALGMMTVSDEAGLHVRRPVENPPCEAFIDDHSMNVKIGNAIASSFAASYIEQGGQIVARVTSNGIILGG